jgi:hypothetical protein
MLPVLVPAVVVEATGIVDEVGKGLGALAA